MLHRAFVTFVVATAALVPAAASAAAEPIGRFALVQNRVESQRPGASAPVAVRIGDPVGLGETETTGEASAAKLTFGPGAVVSLGAKTTFKVDRAAVDQATGASTSFLDVAVGKARVFVSRFWSDRPDLKVKTPTAVVGIKGSEVVIDVTPGGDTIVSVLGGSATIESGGKTTDLAAGRQLALGKGGPAGPAKTLTDGAKAELRASTEPAPAADRTLVAGLPVVGAPTPGLGDKADAAIRFVQGTESDSSKGLLWQNPAANVFPAPPDAARGQIGK